MGCGAGRFCRIAADRGAHISGLDATATFLDRSGAHPGGGIPCRGHRASPLAGQLVRRVTGFNSFIFAANIGGALREARRVARPGGNVAITVFGRPERCESTNVFGSVGQLLPAQSGAGESSPALHEVGTLETLASEAGLTPKAAGYVEFAEEYPDLDTFLRGYLAAGPIVSAIRTLGEKPARDALPKAYVH